MQSKKRANGKGSAIYLGKNRNKPWGARITIGKDINGNAIRFFIDSFETELDALVCLENYHRNPVPLYIKQKIYDKIVTFPKNPYPLVPVLDPKKSNCLFVEFCSQKWWLTKRKKTKQRTLY